MRLALGSVEVTDRERRALSIFKGRPATELAERAEVREFIRAHGAQQLDRLAWLPEYAAKLNEARDR